MIIGVGVLLLAIFLSYQAKTQGQEPLLPFAVFADRATAQGHGLGRNTMPEMTEYSVVTAVHTIWLAARARGIGMGWVSILEPEAVARLLQVPAEWKFIGYFCLGYPQCEDTVPELEQMGWEERRLPSSVILRR